MTRHEWLLARQSGLGSSDAPEILGVGFSGTAGPARVYRSKVEPVDDRLPETGPLRRGIELEPHAAAFYERRMGTSLSPNVENELLRHPERPWQVASPDRRREDDGRAVELKCVAGFGEEWGAEGTGEVPEKYRVQCQHQMVVTGDRMIDLAALDVIGWELRVYRIDADRAFQAWLTTVELRFMGLVVKREGVSADWLSQVSPPTPLSPLKVGRLDLGPAVAALLDRRKELKRIVKDAETDIGLNDKQVAGRLGDTEAGAAGNWKVRWVTTKAYTRPAVEIKESRRLDVRETT
jgi:putative phage-type endonuclease